jgi:hypothetical protein
MKFEIIVSIIIFMALLAFSIFRKMRASSKTGKNRSDKQGSGWKVRFEKFLSQVQRAAGGEDLLENQDQRWKDLSSNTIDPAVEKKPLPLQKPAIPKAFAERNEPAVSGHAISPVNLDFGIQDLRKAVIWSEILAPPLALRDKRAFFHQRTS